MLGKFIVFEGGEGSGKTTQAKWLDDFLARRGYPVILTKEPGGDEYICKDIRSILLNTKYKGIFSPRSELLLFEADRAQHVDMVIRPALAIGHWVICDRFSASTWAYQGQENVFTIDELLDLDDYATQGLEPDFTVWIDIDPKIGLERNGANKKDRMELAGLEFHQKVRAGFQTYFENIADKEKWQKFDGTLPIPELHQQIVATLAKKRLI